MKLRILLSALITAVAVTFLVGVYMVNARQFAHIYAQRDRIVAEINARGERNVAEINARGERDVAEIKARGELELARLKRADTHYGELQLLTGLTKADAVLAASADEYNRWLALGDAAMLNVAVGSHDKAGPYAEELLRLAPNYSKNWNFGNALHKGKLTLGRLALRAGELESAKEFLLEAGRTPGSPTLNSFGPNMTLAKELLEKGERDAVLEYFGLCGKFWKLGGAKLREWAAVVKDGGIPDFGANLLY